jgi:hypothetical protein
MKMVNSTVFVKERLEAYTHKVEKHAIAFYKQGIRSIFEHVKKNNTKKNMLLLEFQHALRNISKWSLDVKNHEWARFCEVCPAKTLKTLLELKTLVIKGFSAPCDISGENLIYECYLNIARELWKNPYIVYDVGLTAIERNEKNRLFEKLIRRCFGTTLLDVVSRIADEDTDGEVDEAVGVAADVDSDEGDDEEAVNAPIVDSEASDEGDAEEAVNAPIVDAEASDEGDAEEAVNAPIVDAEASDEGDDEGDDEEDAEEAVNAPGVDSEASEEEGVNGQVVDSSDSESAPVIPLNHKDTDSNFDIRVPLNPQKEIKRIVIPQHMSLLEKKKLIKERLLAKRIQQKDSFF